MEDRRYTHVEEGSACPTPQKFLTWSDVKVWSVELLHLYKQGMVELVRQDLGEFTEEFE